MSMIQKFSDVLHRIFQPSDDDKIRFQSSGVLTLGVEIELQLIDPKTLELVPRAQEILSTNHKKIKPEFYLNTVEINTGKCNNVHEVEKDVRSSIADLNAMAKQMNVYIATTGVHPFATYADQDITPGDRYSQLIDRNQWLLRRQSIFGLHVHIGMKDGDDCIRFNNFLMNFLPHLLALSASSPFWKRTDTGLYSSRSTTYEAIPTAGQPYRVKNWREFEHLTSTLKSCGSIKILKDLWWDLRPSPALGTLEIRICDGLATLEETFAIVAFKHMLAHWFYDHGSWLEAVAYPPTWQLRENKWRAIRWGLEASLVVNASGKSRPIREDIYDWLEKLVPYAKKLKYEKYIDTLQEICKKGTSTDRQRKIYQKTNSLEEVVKFNVVEYLRQQPIWDIDDYIKKSKS